jgi:cytochrome P450
MSELTCTRGSRRFPFPEVSGEQPPPAYRELLDQPGLPAVVLTDGTEALLVSRHAEVKAVLSDDRFSRASFTGRSMLARSPESRALSTSDAPLHTRRRRAVLPAFTARRAKQLTSWLSALAEQLLDTLVAMPQPVDLVANFTVPFTLRTITNMLGVPSADEGFLRPLVDRMMSTNRFAPEEVAAAHATTAGYFENLVSVRQHEITEDEPGPDLLTGLLRSADPDRLSRKEIAVFGASLLMAGYETTSNQFAMCARMVFSDPLWANELRRTPDAVGTAVEEMLRWSSLLATGAAPHVATADIWLGDTLVRAGQVVVPLTDAANLDPAVLDDPERFRPDRADNPHLAFGHGRHFCLGAHLARVELQVGLSALLSRFDQVTIAVPAEDLVWRRGMFIRGLAELPVRWSTAHGQASGRVG